MGMRKAYRDIQSAVDLDRPSDPPESVDGWIVEVLTMADRLKFTGSTGGYRGKFLQVAAAAGQAVEKLDERFGTEGW